MPLENCSLHTHMKLVEKAWISPAMLLMRSLRVRESTGFAPSYNCSHSGPGWEQGWWLKVFVPMCSQGALAEHRQPGEGSWDWDGAILQKGSGVESGTGALRAR